MGTQPVDVKMTEALTRTNVMMMWRELGWLVVGSVIMVE